MESNRQNHPESTLVTLQGHISISLQIYHLAMGAPRLKYWARKKLQKDYDLKTFLLIKAGIRLENTKRFLSTALSSVGLR